MPRYNPQDDWFAFYYKRWRTSPDVQKMTLTQQGIFLNILIGIAEYGELPIDPWRLKTQIGVVDHRTLISWFKSFGHLCLCSTCGNCKVTVSVVEAQCGGSVSLVCGHWNFTVPKFRILKEKLEKSKGQDVPKQRKEEQSKEAVAGEQVQEQSGTPVSSPITFPAQPTAAKQPEAESLRDWSEDVGDAPAERIRLCVRFKLDLDPSEKEREYYRANITKASLSRPKFVQKLVADCPESSVIQGMLNPKKSGRTEPIQRIHDPSCPTCQGQGIDAKRHCNLCACVRFKNEAGDFVSYYDFLVGNKKTNKFFETDFAKEIPLYKTLGLSEESHV